MSKAAQWLSDPIPFDNQVPCSRSDKLDFEDWHQERSQSNSCINHVHLKDWIHIHQFDHGWVCSCSVLFDSICTILVEPCWTMLNLQTRPKIQEFVTLADTARWTKVVSERRMVRELGIEWRSWLPALVWQGLKWVCLKMVSTPKPNG